MTRPTPGQGWLAALMLIAPCAALAQGPAFDCARASGQVEKLVCTDASLARLDRQLHDVYEAALAKAQGRLKTTLREEQRGWVKGRNECWKADGQPTWLTASWTESTVPGCTQAQYRLRTAELQAVWRLVAPRTVTYACGASPANELVVHHFATDPPSLRLERGDRTVTLWRVPASGPERYEGPNVSLAPQATAQTSGEAPAVTVRWLDTRTGQDATLQCTPK